MCAHVSLYACERRGRGMCEGVCVLEREKEKGEGEGEGKGRGRERSFCGSNIPAFIDDK